MSYWKRRGGVLDSGKYGIERKDMFNMDMRRDCFQKMFSFLCAFSECLKKGKLIYENISVDEQV